MAEIQQLEQECADFITNVERVSEFIGTNASTLAERAVAPDNTLVFPGKLFKDLPKCPPKDPKKMFNTLKKCDEHLLDKVTHWLHPNFFAYFPGGNAFPNILGDMLSTTVGGSSFSWAVQPAGAELESLMMDWLADALGLPSFFREDLSAGVGGGFIQNSASDSIHNSILAARHQALLGLGHYAEKSTNLAQNQANHPGSGLVNLVAYVNKQAHSSVQKGANIALCTIRMLEPDTQDAINGAILEAKILEDTAKGLKPFYCCASLGTTGGCAFDDLTTIGPICKKYNMWLHIDGAYGGNSFICPKFRYLMNGIEHADSMEVNPYKFLLGSIDCSCMYVKDKAAYSNVFTVDPTFPEHLLNDPRWSSNGPMGTLDYRNYGIPISRRMRALKLFCMFKSYGIKKLQNYVKRLTNLAKYLETLIKKDDRFEICNNVILGLVCFRQKPNTASRRGDGEAVHDLTDCQNQQLLKNCNMSRTLHLVPTHMQGKFILRFSVNFEYATKKLIEDAWAKIQSHYVTTVECVSEESHRRTGQDGFEYSYAHILPIPEEEYRKRLADPNAIEMSFGPVIVPITKPLARMLGVPYVPAANKSAALDKEKDGNKPKNKLFDSNQESDQFTSDDETSSESDSD